MDHIRNLREICTITAGQSPESKFYNTKGDGLPFYQGKKRFTDRFIGEPVKWTRKVTKEALPGDVLMSVRAPVGPVNFATIHCCIGRGLASIRAGVNLDKNYLFYFLQKHETEIEATEGAVFNSINKTQIGRIKIPIPPLPEQHRIVAILDQAFAAIDQAKANIERNIENAKELFQSKLDEVFSSITDKSSGVSLNELCELIVDCEHKTAPTQETGYPSIRTPNIGPGYLILDDVRRVSKDVYEKWTRRAIPKPGDLILAREAPAGNVAIIPDGLEVCLGQRTVLLRTLPDRLSSKFLAFLILSPKVQKRLLSHSTGATVGHINLRDIRAFPIHHLLPIQEQTVIAHNIERVQKECEAIIALYDYKLLKLNSLRQSMLTQAYTGQLTQVELMT